MNISAIRSHINLIEDDKTLYEEKNFDKRAEAIDFIEFHFSGQLPYIDQSDELLLLNDRAENIKVALEAIDFNLFKKLREEIRLGKYKGQAFKVMINDYVDIKLNNTQHQYEAGYDNLDVFINGLISSQPVPEQTQELDPEMVYYQKTPARVVFEMAETIPFSQDDIFFDLGSGLGQVAILVNLLTEITVKGIEFEPAFCNYASDCATELNLAKVEFINGDARKTDYSRGTIFFMFTPFKGEIMQDVLAALREEARKRKIKIITYGPCTAEIALQSWLNPADINDDSLYKLAVFTSR